MLEFRKKGNMSMERRKRRTYTEEFKRQIVELYNSGKKKADLIREYDLTTSALDKWIQNYNSSGSFRAVDNRSEEEKLIMGLEKENRQLRMENDILKQAALIMGRKSQ